MNITSITARFKRSRQPAPYEIAEAEVSLTAMLDEGEDATGKGEGLLDDAAAAVYARLGLTNPKTGAAPAGEAKKAAPKKSRGRPKKTDDAPAPEVEAAPEFDPLADMGGEPETQAEPKKITDKDLQDACSARARVAGVAKVKGLLTEFGVARSTEMPADQRQAFLDQLAELKADE